MAHDEYDRLPSHTTVVVEEYEKKSSRSQATFLLINSAVGAGVLSMPMIFYRNGLLNGFLIIVCIASIQAYTLGVLSRAASVTNSHSYGGLVMAKLGRHASIALNVSMLLYLFGSSVAYLLIVGDSFETLWGYILQHVFQYGSKDGWLASRQFVIAAIGCTCILPQCYKKTLSGSAFVSLLNLVAFVGIVLCIILYSIQHILGLPAAARFDGVVLYGDVGGIFDTISIAVFGFQCHSQVVAVFNELEDSQVPRYLKVIKRFEGSSKILVMLDVILKSMLTCAIGYLLVGAVSYSAFPKSIQSNIFNTFGYDSVIISTARLIVGVLQIASYPVNHFPARKALSEGIIMPLLKKEPSGNGFVFVETSVFFTLSLILALSFTELGTVFSLVGGTSGTVIIFIIPGALLLHEARDHQQQNIRILFSISGGFLILFGAGLFLYTLISTL